MRLLLLLKHFFQYYFPINHDKIGLNPRDSKIELKFRVRSIYIYI